MQENPIAAQQIVQDEQLDFWVAYTQSEKGLGRVGWALFVMMSAVGVTILAFYYLRDTALYTVRNEPWLHVAANIVGLYLIGTPLYVLVIRRCDRADIPGRITHAMTGSRFMALLFISYTITYLGNLMTTVLALPATLGTLALQDPLTTLFGDNLSLENVLPNLVYLAILAPVMEEIIFRHFLLKATRKYGDRFCMVFNGLAFSLFHANPAQMLYAFLLGAVFAYIVLRYGALRYTMVIHAFINIMGFSAYFLLLVEGTEFYEELLVLFGLGLLGLVGLGIFCMIYFRKEFFLQPAHPDFRPLNLWGIAAGRAGTALYVMLIVTILYADRYL